MDDDPRRYLARNPAKGYTLDPRRSVLEEPEALTAAELAELAARAERSQADRQRAEWAQRRLEIEKRLAWLISQRLRRDVGSQIRAVQRQLDRIDRRLDAR